MADSTLQIAAWVTLSTFTYTTSSIDLAINGCGFFIVEGTGGNVNLDLCKCDGRLSSDGLWSRTELAGITVIVIRT